MIRDAFGNRIILRDKLAYCNLTIYNQVYTLPHTWSNPFNIDKATQIILGINFIRQQLGGIIVQRKLVTIFKKLNVLLCTTPFI